MDTEIYPEPYPLWKQLIMKGERVMLAGRPQEAEQLYLQALTAAKDLPESDLYWLKIKANLRYLYLNFLCQRPLNPDDVLERTVLLWSEVLGPEHHLIVYWTQYVDKLRKTSLRQPPHQP